MKDTSVTWIRLTQGQWTVIDAEDYPLVAKHKWHARRDGLTFYAESNEYVRGKRKLLRMHNVINPPPEGLVVDHRDGDGLNNRKRNHRHCTRQQNLQNRAPRQGRKYKGVSRRGDRYLARIRHNGKDSYLGLHDTEEGAALAYNKAAIQLFGEYARLNEVTTDG